MAEGRRSRMKRFGRGCDGDCIYEASTSHQSLTAEMHITRIRLWQPIIQKGAQRSCRSRHENINQTRVVRNFDEDWKRAERLKKRGKTEWETGVWRSGRCFAVAVGEICVKLSPKTILACCCCFFNCTFQSFSSNFFLQFNKGAGSFHIHRKTMNELCTLAVLGVQEQPNLAQNLVTQRHW